MNVLVVSDNFSSGGLETHLKTFFKELKQKRRINILFCSNFLHTPYFRDIDLYTEKIYNIKITDYSPKTILELKTGLSSIIEFNTVDFIHSHPFISIISSFMSAVEKNIPFVFTLHGKASLFAPDEVSNLFLKTVVFRNGLGFSVNPSFVPEGNIHYLPNPVDEEFWRGDLDHTCGEYILIVSRLDVDKSHSVAEALSRLKSLNVPVIVAGDGQEKERLEKKYPFVEFVGYKTGKELRDLMLKAAFVCGMGRVILEASFLRKPVILLNYDGDLVILDDDKFIKARDFNFNGTNFVEENNVIEKIKNAMGENSLPVISRDLLNDFSATVVVERYLEIVREYMERFDGYDKSTKSACSFYKKYLEELDYSKRLENEKGELKKEMYELSSKKSEMESKNSVLESEVKLLKAKLNDVKNRLDLLKEERDKILGERELLYNRLNDIYHSKFWKIVRTYQKIKGKLLKNDKQRTSSELKKQLSRILKDIDFKGIVVYPPTVDWNIPLFQRPQHLALNFSRFGYLYFHCTPNAGYDRVLNLHRIDNRVYLTNKFYTLLNVLGSSKGNTYLFVPSTNLNVTSEDMRNYKKKMGFKVIYDFIDEIHESITYGNTNFIKDRHRKLSEENVDLILCVSKKLHEEMGKRFENTGVEVLLVENGVDYNHFHIKKTDVEIPEKIKNVINNGKPVIGYYGALAKWIDYDLINYIAENRQDLNFVFIGVDYDGSAKCLNSNLNNIYYIGAVSYWDLPKYAIWFDVATIPFKMGDVARATSPLKLYEYMSLNKPVVCTKDLIECKRYKSTLIAEDKDDFITKIDEALKLKDDKEFLELVDREARENTWEIRVRTIIDAMSKISDNEE